ncbi:MAG TPA: FAD-linked oxidase C-terminal domain-containing protein [Solirubrobacteraceae bacterium]
MKAERELRRLLGDDVVLAGTTRQYLTDASEASELHGHAEAIVLPTHPEQVAGVMRWCYDHDVPVVARGGGTGLAAGAVPTEGGVVVALERLRAVRSLAPELWRMWVEAGLATADVARLARENGLLFAPDPGAAEQSQIGGNIATNAGGPHAFKYGVTGNWVTGLEVVLAPGELVRIGGPIRKDVAGYDIKSLLIGSEGTLGIITAAWLKLIPAPEAQLPVVAFYTSAEAGCDAMATVMGSGLVPAAIEYLDEGALAASATSFPQPVPRAAAFMLIVEADGSAAEAHRVRTELVEALGENAVDLYVANHRRAIDQLWRWRAGASIPISARRGGKVSEDIVVPLERLAEAIAATREIGARHRLPACSWGHAGDGNLHSTFMLDRTNPDELARAKEAAAELFTLASELGGSVSGEHGLGFLKRGALARQWPPAAVSLHESIKRLLDPKGLLNPGKKLAR